MIKSFLYYILKIDHYDEIYASYCVLIDTIRTMGEGEFVSLVKEEDSQYGEVILYQPNDSVRLEARLQDETVWLTQQQMAELFGTTRNNITLHIGNIFKEGELEEKSVRKESLLTAADGKNTRQSFIIWMLLSQWAIVLGTSVKDIGRNLTTIIKVGFSADFIMDKVQL